MSNIYVTKIKNDLRQFGKLSSSVRTETDRNEHEFLPEVAQQKNTALWQKVSEKYAELWDSYIGEYELIRTALSKASVPSAESISTERLFFDEFPVSLTPQEYVVFSDLHKDNFVWQRFLLNKLEQATDGQALSPYTDARYLIESRLPKKRIEAYKKLYEGALRMLDHLKAGTASEAIIDAFMNEKDPLYDELYIVLGDGLDIADYTKLNLPESAKHIFDEYILHTENGLKAERTTEAGIMKLFTSQIPDNAQYGKVLYA